MFLGPKLFCWRKEKSILKLMAMWDIKSPRDVQAKRLLWYQWVCEQKCQKRNIAQARRGITLTAGQSANMFQSFVHTSFLRVHRPLCHPIVFSKTTSLSKFSPWWKLPPPKKNHTLSCSMTRKLQSICHAFVTAVKIVWKGIPVHDEEPQAHIPSKESGAAASDPLLLGPQR